MLITLVYRLYHLQFSVKLHNYNSYKMGKLIASYIMEKSRSSYSLTIDHNFPFCFRGCNPSQATVTERLDRVRPYPLGNIAIP
jgi:hypothetical protein